MATAGSRFTMSSCKRMGVRSHSHLWVVYVTSCASAALSILVPAPCIQLTPWGASPGARPAIGWRHDRADTQPAVAAIASGYGPPWASFGGHREAPC